MKELTPVQRTAIEDPCLFAFETVKQKFHTTDPNRGVSIIITVNTGYE
jgi:hypothetical protein